MKKWSFIATIAAVLALIMDRKKPKEAPPKAPTGVVVGENVPKDSLPIDDFFWFKLSREWVDKSAADLKAKAESVRNGVVWFFGLGSSFTLAAVVINNDLLKLVDPEYLVLPIGFLFISYVLTVWSESFSIRGQIEHPNCAKDIREVYNGAIKRSKVFLIFAAIFLFLGFVSLPLLLGMALKQEVPAETSFQATMKKQAIPKSQDYLLGSVAVSGRLPSTGDFVIVLTAGESFFDRRPLSRQLCITQEESTFHINLSVPKDTIRGNQKVFAILEFERDKAIKSIVAEVK